MDGVSAKREFVVKTFYTDSLGIVIDKDSVKIDSATVSIDKKDYSTAKSVTVYLLTPEQAAGEFDPTNSSVNYISKTHNFTNTGKEETAKLEFNNSSQVQPNTVYTVRVVVTMQENGETQNYISQQSLILATLKRKPTLGTPSGVADRQSWGFELNGGTVTDPDNAITSYIYRVYNNNNEVVKDIEVNPAKSKQATMLYLDGQTIKSNEVYRFKVIATYNDNEKTVQLESAISNDFTLVGSQLPAVSYQADDPNQADTSAISGTILISKNGSKIIVDDSHPLHIDLMCEGVYERSIVIKSLDSDSDGQAQIKLSIDAIALKSGKVYRMDVSAYVDVNDNTGFNSLNIGHVTAKTRELTTLRAVFADSGDTSKAFSKKINFESAESNKTLAGSSDANDLSQVILRLYDADTNIQLGNEVVYTDEDNNPRTSTLTDKFVTGTTLIDETTFGLSTDQLTSNGYYIQIQGVYDYTKTTPGITKYKDVDGKEVDANVSGYVNEYPLAARRSETFQRTAQPPTLPTVDQMTSQISPTAILNRDVGTYGGTKDASLPDNAIVGYYLEFGYTNNARLARKLHLYAFNSSDIDNKTDAKDLIYDSSTGKLKEDTDNDKIVDKKEFDISQATYSFPKVAILFGNGNSSIQNGVNVVYSQNMERGYFYTFAYGVDYAEKETIQNATKVYPYSMESFTNLSQADQNKYVLSSKSQATPKVAPTVYTYIYNESDKVNLKCAYSDVDNTFTNDGNNKKTQYKYNGKNPVDITLQANAWTDLQLDKPSTTGEQKLDFNYKPYVRSDDVQTVQSTFYYNAEKVTNDDVDKSDVRLNFDVSNKDNNIITLTLSNSNATVSKHTAGVKLRFTAGGISVNMYRSFSEKDGNKVATINLSSLSKLIKKGNITIEAKLLYDSGNQGWGYATNENKEVALGLENQYLSVGATQSLSPLGEANGSLFKMTDLNENKLNNVLSQNASFKSTSLVTGLKFDYTLSATASGLLMTDSSGTSRYAITKELKEYSLSENNKVTIGDSITNTLEGINSIKPSVSISDYQAYTDHVTYERLGIYGFDQIGEVNGEREILVDVYNKNFTINSQPNENDPTYVKTLHYDLSNGTVASSGESLVYLSPFEIKGLNINTSYYITIRAKVNGEYVDLISASSTTDTNNRFRRQFTTAGKINLLDESASIKYGTYRNKYLDVQYSLSQTTGFRIEYTVLDENDNPVLKDENPLTLDSQYGSGKKPYERSMKDQLKLDFDTLGKVLEYGHTYKLAINTYVVDNNGKDILDEAGNKMKSSDQILIPFEIANPSQPFVFDQMWADTDNNNDMNLYFNFSVTDQYKMIMTDTNSDETIYYAKLWEIDGENRTDVSSKVSGLFDGENPYKFRVGEEYHLSLKNPGESKKYQLILYATIDADNDGNPDGLKNLDNLSEYKGSISSLSKDEFETNKETLQMYVRNIYETPSSSGITLGTQSIAACSTDNTKAEITYKNAVGLNNIDRVEYSLTSNDGTSYTKTMDNTDKQVHPLFVQKTGGYFTLTLDSVLQNKGTYNVSVRYYTKSADGQYDLITTYTDIYVY